MTTATMNQTDRVLAGDHGAIARMLTRVERRSEGVDAALASLHPHTGRAHVIGVTGPAGSGKSTLTSALAKYHRSLGRTVGVLAVDPSSSYSGGAILGDRIRMIELSGDEGTYIRSLATRGALGGLSRAALDGVSVLDAAGKDVVILETVGVGQAEVDIMGVAHSVIVVSIPGTGDSVQAIKAGLLEVADIHVVNKSDRLGADQVVAELRDMLRLSKRRAHQWNVPIVSTIASQHDGIEELVGELDKHRGWLRDHGGLDDYAQRTSATRVRWAAEELVLRNLRQGNPAFDVVVQRVAARSLDPVSAAHELVRTATS